MQPTQQIKASDGTPLDPSVVALAKSIRDTESGSNYNATGKSGEHGAYQWMPGNFENSAKEYGLDPNDSSPVNQDKVAYQSILADKKSGLNPEQVASKWNSGNPNAYQQNHTGTNSQGVSYDTPGYVKKVIGHYNTYKQQYLVGQNPQPTPSPVNQADQQSAQQYGASFPSQQNEGGISAGLKAVGNLPSSALNFAEGIGNAVLHPIKTVEGLGNIALGGVEEAGNTIAGQQSPVNPQTQAFEGLKGALYNRYGTLENASRSATNDPFGVGTDIASLAIGGGKVADLLTGAKTADATKAIDYIANTGKTATDMLKDPDVIASGTKTDIPTLVKDVQKNIVDGLPDTMGENFNPVIAQKISTLDPAKYTSVDDFITDAKNVAGKGQGLYSNAIDQSISKVGSTVLAPAKKIGSGLYNLGTGVAGKALGVEGGTIREAVNSSVDGGKAYEAFKEGLTGNVSQDQLVNEARGALDEVISGRSQNYKQMLGKLGGDSTTYDISPVYKEADTQLAKFGITKTSDGLDFSRSKFALDPTAQKDIENLYDYVKSYGSRTGDRTALGVDNLKKVLGGYYSPNSDYRAFTQALKDSTRTVLDKAPGYTEAMKNYAEISDQIDDIRKGLSLGDNAMVETSFKKLTGAFRQNNEFRSALIKELDNVSGGQLLPKIAGQQMSSYLPRGLIGTLEGGGLGFSALSGGTGLVPLLFTMMGTSPKLVAQLIRSLRLPTIATQKVMSLLSKGAKPAIIGGGLINKLPNQ